MPAERRKIGEILLEMGAVDALQLKAAIGHHDQWGVPVGKALIELRFCSEADVARALAIQTGLPLIDLDKAPLDPKLVFTLPVKTAERLRVVPLRLEGKRHEVLVVAAAGPAGLETLDAVRTVSGKAKVIAHLASDAQIERAIGFLYYGKSREAPPPAAVPMREVRIETEETFELGDGDAAPAAAPASAVLLFGWHDAKQKALAAMLKLARVESRPLDDEQLGACADGDVIIAPTLSLQAVIPAGGRVQKGKLIVCGLAQDLDMRDAQALGARVYLRPPFSPEQLAKAILQCQSS